jgi:putative ABC transport system permease protein
MRLFGRTSIRPFEAKPQIEVDEELRFHLEQRIRDYVARGMDPAAARTAALERFGDLTGVRSECTQLLEDDRRAERRRDWMEDLRQDVRFGIRSALRSPVFTMLAVVTLALGIGANAAVFGVVKSVLLDALPYADSDRLVRVYSRLQEGVLERSSTSAGAITDIVARQRSFTHLAAFYQGTFDMTVAGDGTPHMARGTLIGPDLLETLGVRAAIGRAFRDADAITGAPDVVMLTWATWQREFGGDRRAIGRTMLLEGKTYEVVGVLPRGFVGPMGAADLFFPLDLGPALRDPVRARHQHWLGLVGRLAPNTPVASGQRELTAIGADLSRLHPESEAGITFVAIPLRDDMVGETRTPLLVLMGSAALVLLITCANLAGALLSRSLFRRKEFAVRVALGAGRGRLVRQLLTESLVLAVAGGATGLALAASSLHALRSLALPALPPYANLAMDPGVVLVTILVALGTGVAFGVAPALSVGRADTQGTLRDETRGTSESHPTRRLRGMLVAGQIALCISLLAGAGLLIRSLWAMSTAPVGFDPAGVLTFAVQLPIDSHQPTAARAEFFDRFEERLRALPGVTGVASVSELPAPGMNRNGLAIQGVTWPQGEGQPFIAYASVSDDYFRTMRIPLRQGRTFGPMDRPGATSAIVISEGMARRYWPDGNAIGARVRLGPDGSAPWSEVVGIVGDVRNDPARPTPEPMAYASSRQDVWVSRWLVVRAQGDPLRLVKPAERELAQLDRMVPLHDATTLSGFLADRLAGRRLPAVLMMAFGALALLLASVGVYAMFASMAAAREREFGVRIALGATRGGIAALVLRQGGAWMVVGLAGGIVGIVIVGHLVSGLLYGVAPFDPLALGAASVVLLVCAAAALLVPVRRATRVDPITVLR